MYSAIILFIFGFKIDGFKISGFNIFSLKLFTFSISGFPVSFLLSTLAKTGFRIQPSEGPSFTSFLICCKFSSNKMAIIAANIVAKVETTTIIHLTGYDFFSAGNA